MASSKKTNRKLGTPLRSTQNSPIAGLGFPLPATLALDIPRIQGVWREWHKAGIVDRPWVLEMYLELLQGFIHQGLIDWGGLKGLRPTVINVLDQVLTGLLTPEEFEAKFDQS